MTSRSHHRRLLVATLGVLAAALFLPFGPLALADTPTPPSSGPLTLTVVAGGNTYTYPANNAAGTVPGPTIPNVADGQVVDVNVSLGASGAIAVVDVRQCKSGAVISNLGDFDPFQTNNCSTVKLGSGSGDNVVGAYATSGPLAPGTPSVTVPFTIGAGTAPAIEDPFGGGTLPGFTCGPGNPCTLAVFASIASGGGSLNYLSFPITFSSGPTTTTTQAPTTTTTQAPTTTTTQAPTTTTTQAPTTTTTQAPTTTTTQAPTTTTTQAPTTTTTQAPTTTTTQAPTTTTTQAPTTTTTQAPTTTTTQAPTTTTTQDPGTTTTTADPGTTTTTADPGTTSTTVDPTSTTSPTVAGTGTGTGTGTGGGSVSGGTVSTSGGTLPRTGINGTLVAAGVVLLAAGALLVVASRRTRHATDTP